MRREIVGAATLYLADNREVSIPNDAAIVSDPPYGMNANTDSTRFTGGDSKRGAGVLHAAIHADDAHFDPSPWIAHPECILFGYHHWAQRAPVGTVLVWLKRSSQAMGTFLSDGELAWQKGGHGVYVYECIDSNQRRIQELATGKLQTEHPTQKPERLMRWCIQRTKAQVVADPFMGTGTTGVAAVQEGREFIGVEIVPEYFDLACMRIEKAQQQLTLL